MASEVSGTESALAMLDSLPAEERLILPCLQRIQQTLGYVPDESVDAVAQFLNVSRAEVVGVLSFYHDLRRSPPPAVLVAVCGAEACQAQGSRALAAGIETEFGIGFGRRSAPEPVEFTTVYCLGNCALGPAAMVTARGDSRLLGRCDVDAVRAAVGAAQERCR